MLRWRQELAPLSGLRVAIVWQGNPAAPHDALRSIKLESFAPLALPGVSLVSLQQGDGVEQVATQDTEHIPITTLGSDVDADGAFVDTAAILRSVDLVVCCDTAVAHVAGAMGVPVWVALGVAPHWPWLLEGNDSPWYPSVRLFRQPRRGDWASVFASMAEELAGVTRSREHATTYRGVGGASPPTRPLIRTRHGWMMGFPQDVYIGRCLMRHGEYSEEEAQLLCRCVEPGDTVVEVGAHIGALTLPLARRVGPSGRIEAFEPQQALFQMLCGNLALNRLDNVTCHQAGASACGGVLRLPPLDYEQDGNFGGVSLSADATGPVVPIRTIDSLDLPACRLIKIDVEGMEADVVRGARETFERHRPILYIEGDRSDTTPDCVRLIREAGYRLYLHLPPLVGDDASADGDHRGLVSVNLLCLPTEACETTFGLPELTDDEVDWRAVRTRTERDVPVLPPSQEAPPLSLPTTPGDLLDRLTILDLKARRLPSPEARARAEAWRAKLDEVVARELTPLPDAAARAVDTLRSINASLWDAEDGIRALSSDALFNEQFVALSREICRLNDERSTVKGALNAVFNASHNDDRHYKE